MLAVIGTVSGAGTARSDFAGGITRERLASRARIVSSTTRAPRKMKNVKGPRLLSLFIDGNFKSKSDCGEIPAREALTWSG
jgi:hypothetical protein